VRRKRDLWIVLPVAASLIAVGCSDRASGPITDGGGLPFEVEVEDFSASFDVAGTVPVHKVSCSTASGDSAVTGLDSETEWLEVGITVPESGTYSVEIRYAAPWGVPSELEVAAQGCGSTQEATLTLSQGTGIG
jgi:hypothetical protein